MLTARAFGCITRPMKKYCDHCTAILTEEELSVGKKCFPCSQAEDELDRLEAAFAENEEEEGDRDFRMQRSSR